jgi:hypothetical protein
MLKEIRDIHIGITVITMNDDDDTFIRHDSDSFRPQSPSSYTADYDNTRGFGNFSWQEEVFLFIVRCIVCILIFSLEGFLIYESDSIRPRSPFHTHTVRGKNVIYFDKALH